MARNFTGFLPIQPGAFGDGQPAQLLSTMEAYEQWANINLNSAPVYDAATTWAPPTELMSLDFEAGGIYHFQPAVPADTPAAYEYSLRSSDSSVTSAWQTCPDFRLPIPNAAFGLGGVQVRHKAGGNKLASPPLLNSCLFTYHAYPLVVRNYFFIDRVLHMQVAVNQPGYIRIVTNGFMHDFYQGLFQVGDSELTQDFSSFAGQGQGIALNLLGGNFEYNTPIFIATVPN